MNSEQLSELLREEAAACRRSSQGSGEYNTAFWAMSIMLSNLADRLSEVTVDEQ